MTQFTGEIIDIKDETPDVKTFRLTPNEKIDFIPGQYCLVSIPNNEELKGESRPLTFSSSPTNEFVELTVKKMGLFTSALFELKPNDKLTIEGPQGKTLNFNEEVKEDIVFIAGGSGITPFISAIRYAVEKNLKNNITLFYSNKTKKDIIYKEELNNINKGNIQIINTLTKEEWDGEQGRVSKELIQKYIKNINKQLWYVCGPPPMVASIRTILEELKISKENLRIEDWQIPGKHDKN
ncbi:MAG: FAD-dependent oxidoreductase [Candidatus Woesearchaeota archaeon]|jgi:NAD(P)H-flavin reductase|nr:FAD-dependent oxidoreductase [Candidatus Woesearchaeota archaeon]